MKAVVAPTQTRSDKAFNKTQEKVSRSVKIVMLIYICTSVLSRIIFNELGKLAPQARSIYGAYVRNLQIINSAINFPVYLVTNSSFKHAWKKVVGLHGQQHTGEMKSRPTASKYWSWLGRKLAIYCMWCIVCLVCWKCTRFPKEFFLPNKKLNDIIFMVLWTKFELTTVIRL